MRDWFLVVALVVAFLAEVVWPQLTTVKVDLRDPEGIILDATGGSPALTPYGTPVADSLQGQSAQSGDREEGGHLHVLNDAATHSRPYALNIFGVALGMDSHQSGGLLHGDASVSAGPSRQGKLGRHADSGTSTIHR